jgi:hypothetical protein
MSLPVQSGGIGVVGILESAFGRFTSGFDPEAEVPDKCRYVSFLHSLDPKQKWHENNQRFPQNHHVQLFITMKLVMQSAWHCHVN